MIDENHTMQLFGRGSDTLTRKSCQVVVVCEECGKHRVIRGYGKLASLCRSCAKKRMTDETKRKIGRSQKGRTRTAETKQKMSDAQKNRRKDTWNRGDQHHSWKGGISPWRNALAQTQPYKNWRTAVFKRDDYTCQICNERGGRLQAHHIRPIRDHKNDLLIFDINNGITLCEECHREVNGHEDEFKSIFNDKIKGD